jgi:hypothetical protein
MELMADSNKGARRLNLSRVISADRRDSAAFLIVALIVLFISMAGVFNPGGILQLILYPTPSARHDRFTTNDLSDIAQAAQQHPGSGFDITDLGLKHLHFSTNAYSLQSNPGTGGAPATYTLCATFDRSTVSKATNVNQTYQNGDLSVYSVHHKGRQCYDADLGPYTGGTRLVR